jgi:phage shock protein A
MGLWDRAKLVVGAKASKVLDRAEDPRETLDYSYEKQLEMLQKVRRGVADVATARKRMELQAQKLQASADTLQGQAQQALTVGREDLAREALTRRSAIGAQLTDLAAQHADLQAQEEQLTTSAQALQRRVDDFRTRKETIKATYSAAEAQTAVSEAVSGISGQLSDAGSAMQRAVDKTETMKARAGALDELLASGALEDPSARPGDDIQRQLNALSADHQVELELARMKAAAAVTAGPDTPAITGHGEPPSLLESEADQAAAPSEES